MCKTSFNAGARHGEKTSAKKIADMQRTLKVIYTWASFDFEKGISTEGRALDNKHVMDLCEKVLNGGLNVF